MIVEEGQGNTAAKLVEWAHNGKLADNKTALVWKRSI
jgi:hypothetical protein